MDILDAIEQAHRERVGRKFCYVPVNHADSASLWVLAVVEQGEPGYFPVSEDCYLSDNANAAYAHAADLNLHRLGMSADEAAVMVASSMTGSRNLRR